MRTIKANSFFLGIGVLLLMGCTEVNPPSQTLDDYIERSEIEQGLAKLYFYPTTVRMLDKFISNGEGGILKGVEEGRLFYTKSDSSDILARDFGELRTGLETEGFELLAEMRSEEMKTVAYLRDRSIDRYVVLIGGGQTASMLVEMKGEISMKTLQGLSDLNSSNVMSLLELTKNQSSEGFQEERADSANTKTLKVEF